MGWNEEGISKAESLPCEARLLGPLAPAVDVVNN